MPQKKKQPLGMADANAGLIAGASAQRDEKQGPNHEGGSENAAPSIQPAKSKKRKPSEAAGDHGDAPATAPGLPTAKKARAAKPTPDALDVSGVELDDEDSHDVPIYDTCDTIRRKIRAHLRKDGVTQAAFLRAIAAAAFKDGRKIQTNSFNSFMRLKGPLTGNRNGTFYASYVFFEKLRIKRGMPKTADREIMEACHRDGVDITCNFNNVSYIVSAGRELAMDKYGCVFSY